MKRTTNAPERYERPSAARFALGSVSKRLVHTDGFDTDLYARFHVEHTDTRELCLASPDGYPFA